jgi:hypothetical protein
MLPEENPDRLVQYEKRPHSSRDVRPRRERRD